MTDDHALLVRASRLAGVGGWQLDIRTGRIHWTEETRRIHAVGPDFVPTIENALEFYPKEVRPSVLAALTHAGESGEPWDLEVPFVTAAGTSTWVRTQGEVEFADGQPIRILGAFQDIGEHKRLQQRLSSEVTERSHADRELRALGLILESTTDLVVQTDPAGRIVYLNPSARRLAGLQHDEPVNGRAFADFFAASSEELLLTVAVPAANRGAVWTGETTLIAHDGCELQVSQMVIAHRDAQGAVERYSSVMRDISAQVVFKAEVKRQTEVLTSVAEAIPATVVVVGADGRYIYVNSAFERYCGLYRKDIVGRSAADVLGAAEVARRRPWMMRALQGEAVNFTLDYPSTQGMSHWSLSCIPLRSSTGSVDGFVGIGQDVTVQRLEEDRLTRLAQRDTLTGLLNRAGFESALDRRDPATSGGLAVMYVDLDDFKPINDRHGHPTGDRVLEMFAQRLMASVRPTDHVARLGGDEFALALGGMRELAHVEAVAEKIIRAAREPFLLGDGLLGDGKLCVRASIGLAFTADALADWRELLVNADRQLLVAKNTGKGRTAAVELLSTSDAIDRPAG